MSINEPLYKLLFLSYLTDYNIRKISEYLPIPESLDVITRMESHKNSIDSNKLFEKTIENTEVCFQKMRYYGVKPVPFFSNEYPKKLLNLSVSDRPPILFLKGEVKQVPSVAIVGTRNTSPYGEKLAKYISGLFAENNFTIISGLAKGIDSIAHKTALEMNKNTISVLPNSLETIYPIENYKLANDILEKGGGLISELPFGINRGKRSFVQRNRILSALSDIVIPIEMDVKSGTMHTINFADKQNKYVFLLKAKNHEVESLSQYKGIEYLINNNLNKGNFFVLKNTDDLVQKIEDFKSKSILDNNSNQTKLF